MKRLILKWEIKEKALAKWVLIVCGVGLLIGVIWQLHHHTVYKLIFQDILFIFVILIGWAKILEPYQEATPKMRWAAGLMVLIFLTSVGADPPAPLPPGESYNTVLFFFSLVWLIFLFTYSLVYNGD